MADTPTREPTEKERRLHAALRKYVFYYSVDGRRAGMTHNPSACKECGAIWYPNLPERHAPDCLAAPDALTKGDEHG